MKKLLVAVVAVAALAIAMGAHAEEKYVAGGFEASGHINTGFGFAYFGKNLNTAWEGMARDGWNGVDGAAKSTEFGFLLDEVELDLTKTFGENIKVRADLDFNDANIGSNALFAVEQAYVTANIALGNGVEMLFGRFNTPIGFEAVDRNDNDTITRSALFNGNIRPMSATGMKLYYAFSDAVDFHFYVINNLADGINAWDNNEIIPATGFRLGYSWGDEGTESTIGFSGIISPETQRAGKKFGDLAYLADLDFNFWATDAFAIGGEGIFRINSVKPGKDTQIFGGLLNLHYVFSDVWDGTLKYALGHANDGVANNINTYDHPGICIGGVIAKGWLHEVSLAGGYQITDGAKFKAEYRLDYTKLAAAAKANMAHSLLGQFEYAF